jgi:2-methylcitrate dehydratase PrpD
MVKLIYCISKKPELSVEQFQRYWRETHAPLVAERAETIEDQLKIARTQLRSADPNHWQRAASAARAVLDTIGVALAGAVEPAARVVQRVVTDSHGPCTILGVATSASHGDAALAGCRFGQS